MSIILRNEKGSALTHEEMDNNFNELNLAIQSLLNPMPTQWFDSQGTVVLTYDSSLPDKIHHVAYDLDFDLDGLNVLDGETVMFTFSSDFTEVFDEYSNLFGTSTNPLV